IAACPSLHSQNGLLLGLRYESVGFGYSTLWIQPTNHGVVFRKFEGLIVPRNDGFWRVSEAASCYLTDAESADVQERDRNEVAIDDWVTENAVLWFAPLGKTPVVSGRDCVKVKELASKLVREATDKYLTAGKTLAPASFGDEVCGYSSEDIH